MNNLYHYLLDSSYRQLPVSNYCCVPRHDGSGYTTNPHTYIVRGSLAASTLLAPGGCCRSLTNMSQTHV
jgi:hypothetical protein